MGKFAAHDEEWDGPAGLAQCTTIASDGNGEARRECGFHTLGKQPQAPEKKLRKTIAEFEKRLDKLEASQIANPTE